MTTTIRHADFVESIAASLQYISYYHPADYIAHLARAYATEQSAAAKDAIAQILTNSRMFAEGHRPICQDTGIVNVFLRIGMDVRFEGFPGSVTDAVNEGVRKGYLEPDNTLRASVVADPQFDRRNTKDNTPAVVHFELVPGDTVDVRIAAKGGASNGPFFHRASSGLATAAGLRAGFVAILAAALAGALARAARRVDIFVWLAMSAVFVLRESRRQTWPHARRSSMRIRAPGDK